MPRFVLAMEGVAMVSENYTLMMMMMMIVRLPNALVTTTI